MAWLRLGKIAVIAVLAGLAVAGGMIFPTADAAAQGAQGGYTYSQRVCQEYGQQPRWYNVRDGQAAYNGGNSDRGWLIVLERGSSTAYRFVSDANGIYAGYGDNIRRYHRWVYYAPDGVGGYTQSVIGGYVRLVKVSPGDEWEYVEIVSAVGVALNRYSRVGYPVGGQYVRWAHMMWCR